MGRIQIPFILPAQMKTQRPDPLPRQDLRDPQYPLLLDLMLDHRRQWLRLVCPRCHRFQPLEQPLEHQRRHLLPPLRRSQARSLELLQRQLRPLPHPRDLTSQSRSRIPWNMTWIWSFGQTQGSVVGRAALPTSFLCCCSEVTVWKTRNVHKLFEPSAAQMSAPCPVNSHLTYPCPGLVPSMASSMSSAQSAAGCPDCKPVRGCSPAQPGLHVAQCPRPHASTGGPARGLFLLIAPWSLPDLARRWTDCCGDPMIRSPHMANPVSIHTCSGGDCLHPRSGAKPWTCATCILSARTIRGLTRDSSEPPEVIRPACVCNPACRLSFPVSGTAEISHTAVTTWYLSLLLSFKDFSSNPSSPRAFLHRSMPDDYIVIQVGSEILPWCCAAMPRPGPPVKRHRYKPGKKERQERREQKAAAQVAWTARWAAQTRRPRPVTVFGGSRSSSSQGAEVAWDAEQTELAVEVPLEAEEEPIMEDETDSCESVLVEAEDLQAEDNAAEGGDIPQPSTPPAAATEGDQMEEANDLAMQDESGQNPEYYEDPASQSAGRPGWLFSADVMAFAKAYGIRSAFVGDKEILIPRPKQAPAPGRTPTTTEIEHPARETSALELPPRPKRRSEMVTHPIEEGTFTGTAHRVESPPASGMTSDVQIEASCLPPERMNTRRSKWPGWKYSKPAFNPDGSSRRWRTSLVAINLRRPWNYNWRQLFQEMNCTWQLLSTSSVHAAWRLACGYRLAFSRRRWPQIQAKLASMTGHPKCESIHRLVRAHQRLEERHRPKQSPAVRAYTMVPAELCAKGLPLPVPSLFILIPVAGRSLPLLTTSGPLLARVQGPSLHAIASIPLVTGRPMPRPLPGTTPLKAATHSLERQGPTCLQQTFALSPAPGLCQTLGFALRPSTSLCTIDYPFMQEHGICVVFLPSPRCQVCYRQALLTLSASSSDHWMTGNSLTRSSCHGSLIEIPWPDACLSRARACHMCTSHLKVRELSTSPSNKIGPWRAPGTAKLGCSSTLAPVPCIGLRLRINVLIAKTLSRTLQRTGPQAYWSYWTNCQSLHQLHRPCWGRRTRSRVYVARLPVRSPYYALARRRRATFHRPDKAHTPSHSSSHLGPKSQGLAISLMLQLLRYLYEQTAILNCEVEPRVGGMRQVPPRLGRALFCALLGKPRPERIKLFIVSCFKSPTCMQLDQADTRVPAPSIFPVSMHTILHPRHITVDASRCSSTVLQHSCSTDAESTRPYPTPSAGCWPHKPRLFLFLTLLLRGMSPALTHPVTDSLLHTQRPTSQVPSRISKRSYKRAVTRAAHSQQGGTMYKGKWCTLRGLSTQYLSSAPPASAGNLRTKGPQPNGPHVRFLSLNCGGLSQDLYVELLKTLEAMPAHVQPQVVALQETHWSADSAQQYTTGVWQVIQSHRHDNRSAGVLFMLHRSLTRDAVVSFGEPFPGRLLHVRISTKSWALDCLNVYQQTMQWQRNPRPAALPDETTQPHAQETRQKVWTALDTTLKKLPIRHTLLLLGDYNTPMQRHERAGPEVARWNNRLPSDASRLIHLLEDHDLIHLNSWSRRMGPTFIWGDTRTLIDHVFTRSDSADSLARYTGRDKLRIGEWRKGGRHVPLSGILHLRRFEALNRPKAPTKVSWDKSTLLQLVHNPEDPRARAIMTQVGQNISSCSTIQDINDCLVEASSAHAPTGARHTTHAPWQLATLDTSVKEMWSHYRQWKAAARGTTATIWKVWFHYARFQKAHRAFRSAGRIAKKSWYQGRLDELNKHARRHDIRALYQGVRTLAPKTRRVHVQLRDAEGHIITPAEQATLLKKHYEAVYTGLQPQPERVAKIPSLQVTAAQLDRALSLMPTHKAVPLHLAPIAAWKLCAQVVVPKLVTIVNDLEVTPDLWHRAWLALIPKLTKPTLPKHLRPIGLSEVSNRMVTKVLQDRLRPYVEKYLEDIPQWAYIPGRSTLDAAARVQAHCQHIIRLCSPDRWTVREARAGLSRPKSHAGGVQLSLDLSSAFDVLEWVYVAEALDDACVPSELKDHLLEWYRNVRYDFTIQDHTETVAASRGLKQGCLVAPLIWSLVTGRLLYKLALVTDVQWVSQQVTAYADDFHAAAIAHNHQDLLTAERLFGQFLELLVQSGMIINASKSAVLYRFKGGFAKRWLRQHIVQGPDGPLFRIRTDSGRLFEFPVVDSHTYLGTKISYTDPQLQTLMYRMGLAKLEWSRLRKLVCSKHGLFKQDQLRIWFSSVPPTLLYGLAAAGLPRAGGKQLRNLYMRHLRAILRRPAHLSHLSNREVLAKAHLPDICAILDKEMSRLAHNVSRLAQQDSFLVSDNLHKHMQFVRDSLHAGCLTTEPTSQSSYSGVGQEHMFDCRYCGRFFATHCLRRSHESRAHQAKTPHPSTTAQTFDRWKHSVDGMPTCKHCGHQFRKWHNLKKHIIKHQCRVLGVHDQRESVPVPVSIPCGPTVANVTPETSDPVAHSTEATAEHPPADPLPLIRRPSIRSLLHKSGWHALLQCRELQVELEHHCPFCRQWCMDQAAIKRHMTQQHDDWVKHFAYLMPHMTPFRRHMVLPCRYCHLQSVNRHTHWRNCLVIQVSCYLGLIAEIPAVVNGTDGALSTGEKLLRWSVPVPAQPCLEAGTRGGLPRDEEGQIRGSCQDMAETDDTAAQRQEQRQGEGQRKGQRGSNLLAYFGQLGSVGRPSGSSLGQSLGTGHELPRSSEYRPPPESLGDTPRICPGQPAPRHQHVFVRQAGSRRPDSNLVLRLGEMEQDSGGQSTPHRCIPTDSVDESLPHRAVQSPGQHCQERGEHAGGQSSGLADGHWGVENSQMGPCPGEASGSTRCTHQDHGEIDCRGKRAPQDHQRGESLSLSICLWASQGSSDFLGQTGHRGITPEPRRPSVGDSAGMDRLGGPSYHGLSSSQREGRPVVSGPDASMVDEGRVHCERPCSMSASCNVPLCHTMSLPIVDVPVGLQAVMQCLLSPFWCDAQRCHLLHSLYRQLWHNSISKPLHMLNLDKMLQWAAVTRRWRKLHTPPAPAVMLQDLLRSHKSHAHSGEWGTSPHALQEVGAHALIPTTCMCLPISVTPQHASLQECVDDWGSQSSRPCLLQASETVFLALHHTRKGDETGSATFHDLEAIIQLPVAASNTSDIFLLPYQARSLVIRDDSAQNCTIHALHRRVKENDCTVSALSNFALPPPRAASVLLVALRRCECQGSDP